MQTEDLIAIHEFCTHHNIEVSFINSLQEFGLIEIITVEENFFIYPDQLPHIEKMMRLHYDMGINCEGIETIMHLLQKIDNMQQEINTLKSKLQLHLTEY